VSSRTRAAAKVVGKTSVIKKETRDIFAPPQQHPTIETTSKSKAIAASVITTIKSKPSVEVPVKTSRRISNEFEKTEESLYVSALEEIPSDVSRLSTSDHHRTAKSNSSSRASSQSLSDLSPSQSSEEEENAGGVDVFAGGKCAAIYSMPKGVDDFDKENWNDPFQVSNYAMEIFEYLKERESDYKIKGKDVRAFRIENKNENRFTYRLHERPARAVKMDEIATRRLDGRSSRVIRAQPRDAVLGCEDRRHLFGQGESFKRFTAIAWSRFVVDRLQIRRKNGTAPR
jgi:hypothetical protein